MARSSIISFTSEPLFNTFHNFFIASFTFHIEFTQSLVEDSGKIKQYRKDLSVFCLCLCFDWDSFFSLPVFCLLFQDCVSSSGGEDWFLTTNACMKEQAKSEGKAAKHSCDYQYSHHTFRNVEHQKMTSFLLNLYMCVHFPHFIRFAYTKR